jgi:hypothetical protein
MASKRAVQIRDRQRNSTARKNTHKSDMVRAQEQAAVLQKLVRAAREAAKA